MNVRQELQSRREEGDERVLNLDCRVSELIPPRPKYPLKTNSSEKAVQDYHSQIKSIVDSVLDDYRSLSLDDAATDAGHHLDAHDSRNESEYETRRRKLLYELNSSGKYFAFKEQLKNSVVKIVREKFLRTSAFTDQMQMEQFLSELYVFLIDELHKTLNEMMNVEEVPSSEYAFNDTKQMKHFALEAEMNRNFDLAAYYYQEVTLSLRTWTRLRFRAGFFKTRFVCSF